MSEHGHTIDRPAILMATNALSIADARIAWLLSVTRATVSDWSRGIRPIPPVKHAFLCVYVQRALKILLGLAPTAPSARRRIEAIKQTTMIWLNLAGEELGDFPEEAWCAVEQCFDESPAPGRYDRLPGLAAVEIAHAKAAKRAKGAAKRAGTKVPGEKVSGEKVSGTLSDGLYKATVDRMEEAFHRLEGMIDPPELVVRGTYSVFRYRQQTAEAAVIQKLARVISGLRAVLVLSRSGYSQEVGALCRMLDEFNEDIIFLCQAINVNNISALHQQYLESFYEEEFDKPNDPLLSTQKRRTTPRAKIQAAIAAMPEHPVNASDSQQIYRTLHRTHSGFVHAASGHVLEMYGGHPPHYHLSGMLGTPRIPELIRSLWHYFYRGFVSLMFCAVAFRNTPLVEELYAFRDELERASGRTQWNDPAELVRRAKKGGRPESSRRR